MAKKDKLYTVNRFNKSMFVPKENVFDEGGTKWGGTGASWDKAAAGAGTTFTDDYMKSTNAFGISKEDNPFSKGNLMGTFSKEGLGNLAKGAAGGIISGLAGTVGKFANKAISGGLHSGAGSAISSVGSTVGSAVGAINPVAGAIVSVGSQLIGGLTNRAFGTKVDQAKLNAVNANINKLNSFVSDAGDFDSIEGPEGVSTNNLNPYSGGWFTSGSARRKNRELANTLGQAKMFAQRSVENNVDNIATDQLNDALANYAAFGGQLVTSDMGAIDYGFMSDYLDTKKKSVENKNQMNNMFMGTPKSFFDLGGDIQMAGADYSTGLSHVDAGGSHEENPNDGVQMGVDGQGTPNLVEEGETIYNDYVFSNRILADDATKKMFRLPKKKDLTFADISKKLEKEISERPNDPISKAGFKAQMQTLEEQQERQKVENEAKKAKAAFEALSPEEQTAVMQQMAQQNAMAEQAATQQSSPEEAQMMQQQQAMMADGSQAMISQEPPMMAEGGHLYATGSKIRRGVYEALGFHTDREFLDWARKHKLSGDDKWELGESSLKNLAEDDGAWQTLIKDPTFAEAIKDKPALANAISKGYDFGVYRPLGNGKATIKSISKGNWKATNGAGWLGSDDPAWLEATKGMSEDDIKKLSTEDVAKLIRATDSYKKGTKWLQNKDNALLYLNTLINDADTPQDAKDHAARFVKDGQWKNGFKYDYATVFGSNGKGVRETNPGTYWHTPVEATRGAQTQNLVINDDGSVEEIIGNVPTDWKAAGNYSWATPENDMTYNYYRKSAPATSDSPKTPAVKAPEEVEPEMEPVRKADWLRYAGLFGPAVGLGMQMAGIGKPNYSELNAATEGSGNVHLATYKPLGNYLTYRPMDIWFEQNKMDANARATDRAIINNAAPVGTKMAGLLASGYNNQIADGQLYRNALEYNDAKKKEVAEFNRGTDQFNAEAFNRLSQFNTAALNDAEGRSTNAKLHAAQQKLANDASWYNSIYGNVGGIFQGLSDLGRENRETNWRNALVTSGAFGPVNSKILVNAGVSKYKEGTKESKGGAIKRKKCKRGLTF